MDNVWTKARLQCLELDCEQALQLLDQAMTICTHYKTADPNIFVFKDLLELKWHDRCLYLFADSKEPIILTLNEEDRFIAGCMDDLYQAI